MVVRRSRLIGADRDAVWTVVGDPHHLPRWWPRVARVESVDGTGFTQVLRSDRGAQVRADFRLAERRMPDCIRWTQDVEGTPFERLFAASETTIELREDRGATRVELRVDQRLRGFARLGRLMVRRAAAGQLNAALDGLAALYGPAQTNPEEMAK